MSFHRSLIRSDARLTYGQVDDVFAGRERADEPWAEPLEAAREVARALRERRDSLEVGVPGADLRVRLGGPRDRGPPRGADRVAPLIEELMVLANEQVAGYLEDRRLPALYRVHERPEPRSVEFLVDQLASLDIPTPPLPKNMTPQQAADAADGGVAHRRRARRPTGARIGVLVLRSLKQAYYTPRNLGHAGLASARYSHFTSPIRRYPDLVVHRALLQGLGIDEAAAPASELDELGVHTSALEREAMKIERGADDVCLAFLLERPLAEAGPGEEPAFEGEIVGLIEKGAFVRFGEEGFEGFLGVRRMRDWWTLNEQGTALVTESGRALRLGDPIEVTVERVDAPRGRVDLAPIIAA